MRVYYNEIEPSAVLWLQAAMDEGIIAKGVIDQRSIEDVKPDELIGFTQCHFFAGIGGWSIALRLAGWPDDKPVWTGSCPCQPFSTAGKGLGIDDPRHLWPAWFWLIQQCKPDTIFGEQVANAVAKGWLDDVAHDLEVEGYAFGSAIIPACSVGAPHKRDRLWFVGNAESLRGGEGFKNPAGGFERGDARNPEPKQPNNGTMGNAESQQNRRIFKPDSLTDFSSNGGCEYVADTECFGQPRQREPQQPISTETNRDRQTNWADYASEINWYDCPDGKARPAKSGLCLLADGIPAKLRKAALHGYGNAIVPQVAAAFIRAVK